MKYVPFGLVYRLMHPRNVVLVTSVDASGRPNIITLAWSVPVSFNPPLVAINVAPERYSHDLILNQREFTVNIPTMEIAKETLFCGRRSGRDYDKFKETKLTAVPAKNVKPPLIKECAAHLECRLHSHHAAGDHTIFVGEVVAAHVNEGIFDAKFDVAKFKPVLHNGGDDFVTIAAEVTRPRL